MKNIPLIIDSSSLLHRAKNTTGMQLSYNDVASGVVFGFMWQMFKLAKNYETMNFIFCMDSKKSKRKEIFPEYKAKRKREKTDEEREFDNFCYKEFSSVYKYLKAMGFVNTRKIKGYEADDLIASFVLNNNLKDAIIVSGDHDLYQLLPYCKGMLSLATGKLYSTANFIIDYNISPKQWGKVMCFSGCFDKKTEILTDNGWKKFYNLKDTDKVFSMNPATRKSKYSNIDKYIEYEYTGEMYRITGKNIDALITPNHSFFGDTTSDYLRYFKKPKFKEISEIHSILEKGGNFSIPITIDEFTGKDTDFVEIPSVIRNYIGRNGAKGRTEIKGFKIPTKLFMAFLGIYLSDGYTTKNKNGNFGKVGICKTKLKKVKMISRILDAMNLKYSMEKSGFIIHNVPLAEFLHPIGDVYTKRIPVIYKNMSSKYLRILWSYMVLCDGNLRLTSWDKDVRKSNVRNFYTVNYGLAKDFQEIVFKSGSSCSLKLRKPRVWNIKGKSGKSKKQYVLYIKKSKTYNLKNCLIKKVDFSGKVYDIETKEYHTILVRRNNTVYWSSNCSGDGVPGIPGIGPKTAIEFLKGELTSGKKHDAIVEAITKKDILELTEKLVKLPFPTTPKLKVKKNEFNFDAFLELCQTYSFNTFTNNPKNYLDWKSLFEGVYKNEP